jgi:hypothetical protein
MCLELDTQDLTSGASSSGKCVYTPDSPPEKSCFHPISFLPNNQTGPGHLVEDAMVSPPAPRFMDWGLGSLVPSVEVLRWGIL